MTGKKEQEIREQIRQENRLVLDRMSTSDLIAEMKQRGYTTFPTLRVIEKFPDGWVVPATELEQKNGFQPAASQKNPQHK